MNVLYEIAQKTKERIQFEKEGTDLQILLQQIEEQKAGGGTAHTFLEMLQKEGMSYICEVKKASPFQGTIIDRFSYLEIAEDYEAAGASAISCLTEPFFFEGSDQYLWEITGKVSLPVLRKDFVVDEYMIYQAKASGAAAVILYAGILDDEELKSFHELASSLDMDVMIEANDEEELERALKAGTRIIGASNRDLRTFEVDISRSIRLKQKTPDDIAFVSDGGITTPEQVKTLYQNGIRSVLIGEAMMKSSNRRQFLFMLNKGLTEPF